MYYVVSQDYPPCYAVSQDYPPCYQEGVTWATQSIDALPGTESAFACQAACIMHMQL